MSTFASTRTKLKAILDEMEGAGQSFKAVFDYIEPSPQQYPCAMIRFIGCTEERLDSANNLLNARFLIRVFFRAENTSSAEDLRISVIDSLVDKLREADNVDTLDGTVERFSVESGEYFSSDQADQPGDFFDFIVIASKIKAIT